MSIEFVSATPGSGMTYSGPHPSSVEPVPEPSIIYGWSPAPLPCVCCGEDVFKNHLCKDCFDSMLEEVQS